MRKLLLILFAFLPMMVQAQKISRPETIRSTEFGTQKMMVVDSTFVLVIKTGYKPISVELGTKDKTLKILRFQYYIDLGKRYGFMHYIPLVFRKNFSAQVLKANMKIVGNCEYGLVLYKDKLPKFNNDGRMIFNCFDWIRDNVTPKVHPTQKPVPLLEELIRIFTDEGDVVIDPFAHIPLSENYRYSYCAAKVHHFRDTTKMIPANNVQ